MKQHYTNEKTGINYTLSKDGMYYPDLSLPVQTDFTIGKYGKLHLDYIKSHKRNLYIDLLMSGKLNEYLHGIDEQAHTILSQMEASIVKAEGLTEQDKNDNPLRWTGIMNNAKNCAEEIIFKEIIYM